MHYKKNNINFNVNFFYLYKPNNDILKKYSERLYLISLLIDEGEGAD